jgi:hypothetical protein
MKVTCPIVRVASKISGCNWSTLHVSLCLIQINYSFVEPMCYYKSATLLLASCFWLLVTSGMLNLITFLCIMLHGWLSQNFRLFLYEFGFNLPLYINKVTKKSLFVFNVCFVNTSMQFLNFFQATYCNTISHTPQKDFWAVWSEEGKSSTSGMTRVYN